MIVSIRPIFDDVKMVGDYDDNKFMQAEQEFQDALSNFVEAGARSENIETAITNALSDLGFE